MKILVADDEPVHRRLLETTFRHWGHDVTTFEDGEELWDALQQDGPPALIVADWDMPRLNGLELVERVREDPTLTETPILIITVRASTVTADPRGGQANGVLVKPWNPKQLRTALEAIFGAPAA